MSETTNSSDQGAVSNSAVSNSFVPALAATINIDKVAELDLRVALIEQAERLENSKKLMKLQCCLGALGKRQILAGIAKSWTPEQLVGKKIVVVANLETARLAGSESQGMLLATSLEDGTVLPLDPGAASVVGARVS